jgi:hypothetical protein
LLFAAERDSKKAARAKAIAEALAAQPKLIEQYKVCCLQPWTVPGAA